MKKEVSRLHIIGDRDRRKVMLIHGVGFYWESCFRYLVEELKDSVCIIIPELEGHCKEPEEYMVSVASTADSITRELSEQNLTQVDVVYGISLGASIAMELAFTNRLTVRHFILDSGQYESMGDMTEQFSSIMADQFLNVLKGEHLISPVKENMGYLTDNDVEVLQPMIFPDITREALYQAFMAAYSYDIKERTEKVKADVMIMLGGNEIYAKNSIPLVEDKCVTKPEVYEVTGKAHAEVLAKEPALIVQEIQKRLKE